MAIQVQGNGGVVQEVDGTLFRAARVTTRPLDYGSLGSYSLSGLSGTIAAAFTANGELFQFRWTDATRLCVVNYVSLDGLAGSATAFTAGFANVQLFAARGWSADGSGGTTLTPATNANKLRTSMGTTLLGSARIASTAALTAGTKTLDSQPLGQINFSIGTTASVNYLGHTHLLDLSDSTEHPLVLATNEGFIVRATVPATGTWQCGVTVRWTELAAY